MRRIGLIGSVVILSAFVITADAYGARNSKPKPSHDVAVTNISVPSSCVQGDTVHVMVTVKNQGNHDESFNITLTDVTDGKEIDTQLVSLAFQASVMDDISDLTFDEEVSKSLYFGGRLDCCDIDNDNYNDVIIGGSTDSGEDRAYLYWGGPNMDADYDLIFEVAAVGESFCSTVTCSDIDNDNYGDVLIGSRNYNNGQGRVYLYWGDKRADMDVDVDLIFDVETGGTPELGSGMRISCGDVDNDNYQDILISGVAYDGTRGRAYLYWGNTKTSMDTGVDLIFEGENQDDEFSYSTGIGNIDNDNYDDIVIGARGYPAGRNYGRAYLYWGKARGSMTANADLIFEAEASEKLYFGQDVSFGNIDNDGYDDLLIGAQKYNDRQGRAYLYYGDTQSQFTVSADKTFNGEVGSGADFGFCIVCSNINGDDYDDVLIGADASGPGYVFLYYGDTRAQMNETVDHTFTGESTGDYFSLNFTCGDVNNDNYSDLIAGAVAYPGGGYDGRAYLYYGGPSKCSTDVTLNWDTSAASKGKHILKVEINPVAGEEDTADNSKTITVDVKSSFKGKKEK
ncbi:MAG: CARDB domain-containing protein [Phycisphaerae bacterium]